MKDEYQVAWWNLENLFDIENSPSREKRIKSTIKAEVRGWTRKELVRKMCNYQKLLEC